MNIKDIKKEGIKELVAKQEDDKGGHMLWVSTDGEIYLDLIPAQMTPLGYCKQIEDSLKFRLETFQCGNRYVGLEASKDDEWIDRLYKSLIENWEAGNCGYIDQF